MASSVLPILCSDCNQMTFHQGKCFGLRIPQALPVGQAMPRRIYWKPGPRAQGFSGSVARMLFWATLAMIGCQAVTGMIRLRAMPVMISFGAVRVMIGCSAAMAMMLCMPMGQALRKMMIALPPIGWKAKPAMILFLAASVPIGSSAARAMIFSTVMRGQIRLKGVRAMTPFWALTVRTV